MAKFRIRLKLQGLDLEVDGERQDLPAITQAVQQQLSNLVIPGEVITDGHKQLGDGGNSSSAGGQDDDKKKRPGRRAARTGDGAAAAAIEFRHDAAKYGNPTQDWNAAQKCIWLLFVIEGTTGTKEVSGPQLAATFNTLFKASGKLHPPHVTRDLAKEKIKNPAPIGEDKGLYYLTDEGKRQAQQLIESVRAAQ